MKFSYFSEEGGTGPLANNEDVRTVAVLLLCVLPCDIPDVNIHHRHYCTIGCTRGHITIMHAHPSTIYTQWFLGVYLDCICTRVEFPLLTEYEYTYS